MHSNSNKNAQLRQQLLSTQQQRRNPNIPNLVAQQKKMLPKLRPIAPAPPKLVEKPSSNSIITSILNRSNNSTTPINVNSALTIAPVNTGPSTETSPAIKPKLEVLLTKPQDDAQGAAADESTSKLREALSTSTSPSASAAVSASSDQDTENVKIKTENEGGSKSDGEANDDEGETSNLEISGVSSLAADESEQYDDDNGEDGLDNGDDMGMEDEMDSQGDGK